jgi:hypothetical protein
MVFSVCTVEIYCQSIKEEKNGFASPNVNGAVRSVQANMKTGLHSSAVTILTPRVLYMSFLSDLGFHFSLTCYSLYFCNSDNYLFVLL